MTASAFAAFSARVPRIARFIDAADASRYLPLPDGWLVGVADVVRSADAIAAGRYKAVNMVGAGVIAAVRNALGGGELPFVFGGDGAAFVVPAALGDRAAAALAAVAVWTGEEMGLRLRTALVPVADVRAAGLDVCVAYYAVNDALSYAMFAGGGVAWAEAQMKAGRYEVAPAPAGARPDLSSLSCRWRPIRTRRGLIASLLVHARDGAPAGAFERVVRELLTFIDERENDQGRPLSIETARFALSPQAVALEARASRGRRAYWRQYLKLLLYYTMVWLIFFRGRQAGSFGPVKYRREMVGNADFRKFDDGLKLTIDCSPETYRELHSRLGAARRDGVIDYGLHAQQSALMTCIVPSYTARDHMHFIDGADGGYAKAAEMLKTRQ